MTAGLKFGDIEAATEAKCALEHHQREQVGRGGLELRPLFLSVHRRNFRTREVTTEIVNRFHILTIPF